jgi:hypothetical protein
MASAYQAVDRAPFQPVIDELLRMDIPTKWRPLLAEEVARQWPTRHGQKSTAQVLAIIRHPCFKARARMVKISLTDDYEKNAVEAGIPPEDIQLGLNDKLRMFIIEALSGFTAHTADYDFDAEGFPIAAKNSRAYGIYGQPPPVGCNLPKSPSYVGGKRKTRKRTNKKRKTKKRV